MPHMAHSLRAWIFLARLCLDKYLNETRICSAELTASAKLVRPFNSHPHGLGKQVNERR
jgi:hypothetical protein